MLWHMFTGQYQCEGPVRTYSALDQAFQYLEAEGHDFAGEAVPSEESLHGVSQLHLFGEHVPQQLVEKVAGVEQGHQDSGQLILEIGDKNSQGHSWTNNWDQHQLERMDSIKC